METHTPLVFKIASEDWEFDLIHQLNYKTFVEEIPQHSPSATRRRVDPFHAENTYLICLSGRRLAGMLAVRAKRPFSLDLKLPNLDSYLPPGRSLCEIRLLSVDKKFRTGQVFQGLMALVWQFFIENGHDMALISGTTRQFRLYHHVGFIPFGPLTGVEGAQFQPMYLSIESFEAGVRDFLSARNARNFHRPMVNFLPGPVSVSRLVRRAFEQIPESHRGEAFVAEFQATKQTLCQLTGAPHAEILLGSGSLANDAIAAQLSSRKNSASSSPMANSANASPITPAVFTSISTTCNTPGANPSTSPPSNKNSTAARAPAGCGSPTAKPPPASSTTCPP